MLDPCHAPIVRDSRQRRTSHRTHPLPRTLSKHPRRLPDHIDIPHIQPDQFRQPHACGVKKLDDCRVACRHPLGCLLCFNVVSRRLDQHLDLRGRQKNRERFNRFWQRHLKQHIFFHHPPHVQKRIERPQCSESQPHTCLGHPGLHHLQHPSPEILGPKRLPTSRRPKAAEHLKRNAVGCDRSWRCVFFSLQIHQKLLRPPVQIRRRGFGLLVTAAFQGAPMDAAQRIPEKESHGYSPRGEHRRAQDDAQNPRCHRRGWFDLRSASSHLARHGPEA